MGNNCINLHQLFNSLPRRRFPIKKKDFSFNNGIYILFEEGETAHGIDRIVRVGTHKVDGGLITRLGQHLTGNKAASSFKMDVGTCLLRAANNPFFEQWEQSMSFKEFRAKYPTELEKTEKQLKEYIQDNFSFVVFQVNDERKRDDLESKIISTIYTCKECKPSKDWLGLVSPKGKIKESGLWLVQKLTKEPLSDKELVELENNLRLQR